MDGSLRKVVDNYQILNSLHPTPISELIHYLMKPMLRIFNERFNLITNFDHFSIFFLFYF